LSEDHAPRTPDKKASSMSPTPRDRLDQGDRGPSPAHNYALAEAGIPAPERSQAVHGPKPGPEARRSLSRTRTRMATPGHPFVPLATKSTSRPPHFEHTSRLCQSRTRVSAPYRSASCAGSGSTWCWQPRHQTIRWSPAFVTPPSVIGGPGSDLTGCAAVSGLIGLILRVRTYSPVYAVAVAYPVNCSCSPKLS
jgi:hypothetical protein